MTKETLWPEFSLDVSVRSPKTVLDEQAKFLANGTKNVLTAGIRTFTPNDGYQTYQFSIIAPSLSNFNYTLLRINQKSILEPYPCELISASIEELNDWTVILSEDELSKYLKLIFNHESTQKVINALISQSKAA